jgi:hypothetical protein
MSFASSLALREEGVLPLAVVDNSTSPREHIES